MGLGVVFELYKMRSWSSVGFLITESERREILRELLNLTVGIGPNAIRAKHEHVKCKFFSANFNINSRQSDERLGPAVSYSAAFQEARKRFVNT